MHFGISQIAVKPRFFYAESFQIQPNNNSRFRMSCRYGRTSHYVTFGDRQITFFGGVTPPTAALANGKLAFCLLFFRKAVPH